MKEDPWRHFKWLSFIEKRLGLAKSLLKNSGAIFISIDDNESAQLKMLCDEIFGEENFVATLPRLTEKNPVNSIVATLQAIMIMCLSHCKNKTESNFKGIEMDENKYKLSDKFESKRGKYTLSQTLDYDSLYYNPAMDFPIKVDGFSNELVPGGDLKKHKERHAGNHKQSIGYGAGV